MTTRNVTEPFDAAVEGKSFYFAGDEAGKTSPVEGDSPTEGTVDGPLAPQPSAGGVEPEPESEMRPRENDARKSDGVLEFKKMEENAEEGRE